MILMRECHRASAEGMLRLSRHHRIRGLGGRGKLVAIHVRLGSAEDPSDLDREISRQADG